jgi:hypothetical protein
MTSRCMDEETILRLLDGELTENDAERSRGHLRTCGVCAARADGLKRVLRDLKAPLPGVDHQMAIEDVMRRLPTAVPEVEVARAQARVSRFGLLMAGFAAALTVAGVFVAPRVLREQGTFLARGGPVEHSIARAVGVSVYRSDDTSAPLLPEARVTPNDAFRVKYRNLLEGPAYLLAFAIDAKGTVHWICPAYLDPTTDPPAVALPPTSNEVGIASAMQFEAPAPGPMRFVSILTTSPLHVRDVETLHGTELDVSSLRARWPTADVRELVTVRVESAP